MALQLRKALIPPHPLTNSEIREYYENEPRFNGVYSRDNLPKTIKNGTYVINLDEYADVGGGGGGRIKFTRGRIIKIY